jgi:hypothetical protein
MSDVLDFALLHHAGSSPARSRSSFDFLINGQSLRAKIAGYDLCGRLSSELSRSQNLQTVEVLTGERPADLGDDRIILMVCPECGDIGCGAFTCRLSREDQAYVWSDFAFENDYDREGADRASFRDFGPYVFAPVQYRDALLRMIAP